MKYSLRSKLSVSYILVALICVFLISVISNLFLERQFRVYIKQNQEKQNKEIAAQINRQYEKTGQWKAEQIQSVGLQALEGGLIITVKDSKGAIIWDALTHNSGLCQQMMDDMARNMMSHYPNWKGEYIEKQYPLTYNKTAIGTVQIGYYGPFFYNANDLAFIDALNQVFLIVGIVSLFFAFLFGAIMAKRLATPISRVTNTAQMISKGCLEDRCHEKSNIREINQLTAAINNLAENLQKQESLRKRLTADVAHELRTPLATLQSHMEAMIDGIWKPDTARLKSCHEEIMRLNRMVGDLEKLARYESENLMLNRSTFDVSELIKGIVMNFENEFKSKGVLLDFQGAAVEMTADEDKIKQIIINLLSNGLKYTPKGGAVEIKAEDAGDSVEITVKDTGIGISQENLPHIFERFYRADQSRNRMTGGAGIGLTIVKAIVEAHKGHIEVESVPEVGTVFCIRLPKME